MNNWQNEFIADVVYEVEQENKLGGGCTLGTYKTIKEAEDAAYVEYKNLTSNELKKYRININTYKWNSDEEEYEYSEGYTYEPEEDDDDDDGEDWRLKLR